MPPEQDWTGKEMAILSTSAMRQKAYRLCFIPNSRKKLTCNQIQIRVQLIKENEEKSKLLQTN